MDDGIRNAELFGFQVTIDDNLGHIAVEHDGSLSWDQLFEIKNVIWGNDAQAIEVYPRRSELVNNKLCRHLWRLGEGDFCPDLLGRSKLGNVFYDDNLENRYWAVWQEATE